MPRSIAEILAHGDELADRFEALDLSDEGEMRDATTLATLRRAVIARAEAERSVRDAVGDARRAQQSWSGIAVMLGTSGEAARNRYRDAERVAADRGEGDASKSDRLQEIVHSAGITPDELRELAGVLEFAATLSTAGHTGPVAEINWTSEKRSALSAIFGEMTGSSARPGSSDPSYEEVTRARLSVVSAHEAGRHVAPQVDQRTAVEEPESRDSDALDESEKCATPS